MRRGASSVLWSSSSMMSTPRTCGSRTRRMVTTDSGRRHGIGGALPALVNGLRAAVGLADAQRRNPMLWYARGVRALDVVAHELRAPLTVIRGYLSLIEDGTYPAARRGGFDHRREG